MDEVPQRRPGPPCSSSCPTKLPPIWGVLWVFFLLLQRPRRPRLRRRSRGPPPWCGAAAAEVSETEPGLEQAAPKAGAMAGATSVSPPGKGGCGAETFTAALHSCHFYFCLLFVSLSLVPFFSRRLCPFSLTSVSLSPHCSSLAPCGCRFPFSPSSPHSPLFLSRGCLGMEGRGQV